MKLTQKRLKEVLHYEPMTGVFTWLKTLSPAGAAGKEAGHTNRYRFINIFGKNYRAHNLAWLYVHGAWPEGEIDHINGIPTDNRVDNLRVTDRQGNCKNQKRSTRNSSGIMGVHWNKVSKGWLVRISDQGERIYLGQFGDFFEACCIRKSAENRCGYHPNHGRI